MAKDTRPMANNKKPSGRHARLFLDGLEDKLVLGTSKGKYAHAERLVRTLDAMTLAGAIDGDENDRRNVIYFFGASVLASLAPNAIGPEDIWRWLGSFVTMPEVTDDNDVPSEPPGVAEPPKETIESEAGGPGYGV